MLKAARRSKANPNKGNVNFKRRKCFKKAGFLFSSNEVTIPKALQAQDAQRQEAFIKPLTEEEKSNVDKLRDRFYKMVTMAMQTTCTNGRMVAGSWLGHCGAMDGQKFVCFDDILKDPEACLIYSFGVGADISFEEAMADVGCSIRLFDHTIEPGGQLHPNTTYFKLGIGDKTEGSIMTLKDILEKLGDKEKEISYLKVDAEGAELKALRDWIESGALDNVRQIGVEFHTHMEKKDVAPVLMELVEDFQSLNRMGFRLISYDANACMGKVPDPEHRYYSLFELVFYRPR